MRPAAVLAALLALGAFAAPAPARAADASDQTKFVEHFVKTPIPDLPPDRVDEFMAVDPATLPAKLRPKYEARRLELQTLKQLATNKKKGMVRTPDKNCDVPDEAKSDKPSALGMAGFTEIDDQAVSCVQERTGCTERDMLCEFSLQIVLIRDPKTKRVRQRRYFLYPTDPLMAIAAACRSKSGAGGNTNFFGSAGLLCSH